MKFKNNLDIYDFSDEIKKRTKQQRSLIYELLNSLDSMDETIDRIKDELTLYSNTDKDKNYPFLQEKIEEKERSIRTRMSLLYDSLSAPYRIGEYSRYEAERYEIEKFWKQVEGIKCVYENEKFYIRIPMLLQKIVPKSPKDQRLRYPTYYDYFFADVLNNEINAIEKDGFEFTKWIHKTINYCFIYSSEYKQFADSDSHDTKAITDALSSQFPTGDSGLYTTEVFRTFSISDMKTGTYIIINNDINGDISIEEELKNMKRIFEES